MAHMLIELIYTRGTRRRNEELIKKQLEPLQKKRYVKELKILFSETGNI